VLIVLGFAVMFSLEKNTFSELIYSLPVFILGFLLWYWRVLGGGDVKLLVAISPTISTELLLLWILLVCVVGGIVAIVVLLLHRLNIIKNRTVPYSIPIAVCSWLGMLASL
jgi:prepilin peptidase CpaA